MLHGTGCDILAPNDDGITPLLIAALKGRMSVVQYLLDPSADCNVHESNKNTPLISAIQGHSLSTAKLLCEHRTEVSIVRIMHAVQRGHYDLIRAMIPFSKVDAGEIDFGWASAVWDDIKEFLRVGIPVKELGKRELKAAIFEAILKEQYELVAAIISKHKTRDIVEEISLLTPIHVAAEVGNLEVFNLLIEKGFPINKQTQYGQTFLHLAALRGHCKIIHALKGVLSTEIVD